MTQVAYIDKALTLLGGYVLPFTAPPDPVSNPTVLDAEQKGRVIVVAGTAVPINGFHITGGNANQDTSPSSSGKGGGIFDTNATLTLTQNTIYDNVGSLFDGESGGIVIESSRGALHDNTIRNNVANTYEFGLGGGIHIAGTNDITLRYNTIVDNVGSSQYGGNGGGISWIYDESSLAPLPNAVFAYNLISGNTAGKITGDWGGGGGGIFLSLQTESPHMDPLITLIRNGIISNGIISNTAVFSPTTSTSGVGGGVLLHGEGLFAFSHNRILSNTAIVKPSANTIGIGGGLAADSATITFNGDRFQFNQLGSRGAGDGFEIENCVATMTNVVIVDHQSMFDSVGIQLYFSQITMQHPTIVRNGSRGIWIPNSSGYPTPDASSQVTITNANLAGHTMGIMISHTNKLTVDGVLWYDTDIAFAIEPGADFSIKHQVVGDPLFATDGYHLTEDSAAIRQGMPTEVSTDIDGDGRPFPPALGADEYMPFKLLLPLIFNK